MASITRYRSGWRAFLYLNGVRTSKTFVRLHDAKEWARKHEQTRDLISAWPKIEVLDLEALRKLPIAYKKATFPGVYFLWDATWGLAYIGQSRNVAKRVQRHMVEPPAAFEYATYLHVPFPWQLSVEVLYIAKYGQPGYSAVAISDIPNRVESYVPRVAP
jgi:hypothetical protein